MKIVLIYLLALPILCFAETYFQKAESAREQKDWAKAISLYQKAHDQGNALASHWLGTFYYDGVGVNQDYEQAANYFLIAANSNIDGSMVYLVDMYINGRGVGKSCSQATKWVTEFSKGTIPAKWQEILNQCQSTINQSRHRTASPPAV